VKVPHAPSGGKTIEVPEQDRLLISEAVAAQLCGVSLKTFRKWMSLGFVSPVYLPGGKDGGSLRRNLYRRADIEAFTSGRSAQS
jgi:hypothetical protein